MSTDAARPEIARSARPAPGSAGQPPVVVFAALDDVPAEEARVPAAPAATPAWFRNKPASETAQSGPEAVSAPATSAGVRTSRKKPLIQPAPEETEQLSFSEKLKRWVLGTPGLSYGVSMLFHAALLVILALIVYHSLPTDERGTLLLDSREDDEISLSEIDTRIDLPPAQEDLVPPQFQALPVPDVDSELKVQADLDEVLPAVGADGEGSGGGTGLALPRGENAVTKGSFTAWTIPEDPEPAKDYLIVIEVTIPENVKTYRLVDLAGVVVGTDLYTQSIPYDPRNPSSTAAIRDGKPVTLRDPRASLPVRDGRVQLLIRVPGAAELVKDTIRVRSKILKENQELEIQF